MDETRNKKILIIPSWYYSKAKPTVGSFFLEQSRLLVADYDLRILFGSPILYGRKKFYKVFFSSKERKLDSTDLALLTPPRTTYFDFFVPTFLNEEVTIKCYISSYKNQFRILIKEGWIPDLIHAHSSLFGGIVAKQISLEFKIPFIVTEHQSFNFDFFTSYQFKLVKSVLECADLVLSVSKYQSKMLLMNGIDCNPLVVGNLVNDSLFKLAPQKKANNKFSILTVGFHSYLKDMKTFFKAILELVNNGFHNFNAVIISPKYGGVYFDYQFYAKELGISSFCIFIEELPRDQIAQYFQNCDVFVSTAIAETFGVSVAEALCCGKPVIVTNSGGVSDFVKDGQNGYIVEIKDYKSIANRISKIINGELIFTPNDIRQNIVNEFGNMAFKEKISTLYKTLL